MALTISAREALAPGIHECRGGTAAAGIAAASSPKVECAYATFQTESIHLINSWIRFQLAKVRLIISKASIVKS